jgi:hypothetical protein
MKDKVSFEVAEQEFFRFCESMDLDADEGKMSEEKKEEYQKNKSVVVKAIQKGSLFISENGEPTFTPQRTKDIGPIIFYEPTGSSLMAMDKKKGGEDIAKLYSAMADMTKTHAKTFANMKMADLKVCMTLFTFFLS